MGRRLLVLVGLLGAVLLTACGGDGGGGVLGGAETYEGDGYAVDYPEGWEVVEGGRVDTASAVELIGPDDASPFPPLVRVARMGEMGHLGDVDAVAVSVVAELRPETTDLTVREQTETDVTGAESAVSMRLAYSGEVDGATADVRELAVVAVSGSDSDEVTVVRFLAPAERFDELADTFEDLASSIRVE